ncbi:MAG TPA: ATP-dependent helicase HrpB, partial [Candidatus Methylomirabilis sp.]
MPTLPIEAILRDLRRALEEGRGAVVTAPPGAGKTTLVPPALLDAPWLGGQRIVMLEPRRLAARAAAHRMASLRGETVGQTVGYRIRLDTRVGPQTRIEVVTEAILTRLLQHDPSLAGYGLVIFDEFHERGLHADLGLVLCLEARRLFRPDLRLLAMSATLDAAPVARLLGEARVLSCEGRQHPVETRYLDRPLPVDRPGAPALDRVVAETVRRALAQEGGSVLVFLPGMAEIRRVERRLRAAGLGGGVLLAVLHGDIAPAEQDVAIAPAPPGLRKVVLSSAIAETSLTIEGIRVVVDAGFMRVPRFDPRSGLTRLDTIRVSRDSADQRRGRAGRLEPGVCFRLWTPAEQQALPQRRPPEIFEADLASLALELALWGAADVGGLSWLDPPPAGAVAQARDLLARLGALDARGRITGHGRQMAELAVHPRLAHMMLRGAPLGLGGLACEVAALLTERDMLRGPSGWRDADLRLRLDALHGGVGDLGGAGVDRAARDRARVAARQWKAQLNLPPAGPKAMARDGWEQVGVILAFAYPDRIAQRQPGAEGRYLLANGRGAWFPEPDPLAGEEYLVVADLDGAGEWSRIHLAAPLPAGDLETCCADLLRDVDSIAWDERARAVRARRQRRLGELTVRDEALPSPDPARVAEALVQGIRQAGLGCLPWTVELRQWQARVAFVRRVEGPGTGWPEVSDRALVDRLEEWLGPFLGGMTRLDHLQRLDLGGALRAQLPSDRQRRLDRL